MRFLAQGPPGSLCRSGLTLRRPALLCGSNMGVDICLAHLASPGPCDGVACPGIFDVALVGVSWHSGRTNFLLVIDINSVRRSLLQQNSLLIIPSNYADPCAAIAITAMRGMHACRRVIPRRSFH